MAEPLRLFVLAGEPSGDRIGADLAQRLKAERRLELSGVGGPELTAEGLASLFPMDELSVMGWSDVVVRLPLLFWRVRQVAAAIVRQRPDVAVLIDSQVFSRLVAERVRKAAPEIPLMLYVAPTVWAWRPERAAELKPLFDEVLAVLPFEPATMLGLGGPPTSYVGHPALRPHSGRAEQPQTGPLLLLPGSRVGELKRHLSLMRAAAEGLAGHPRVTGFVVPTLDVLADRLRAEVANWPVPVQIVTGPARARAFADAVAAFAVSGTITLELALSDVPMVVTYVGDRHQAKRYHRLERPPMIGLPNIVAGRTIVPELLFTEPEPARAVAALGELLGRPGAMAAQIAAFRDVRTLLETGAPDAPLVDPAVRVLGLAGQRRAIGS